MVHIWPNVPGGAEDTVDGIDVVSVLTRPGVPSRYARVSQIMPGIHKPYISVGPHVAPKPSSHQRNEDTCRRQ